MDLALRLMTPISRSALVKMRWTVSLAGTLIVMAGLLALWPHTVRGIVTDADGNFELHVQGYALHRGTLSRFDWRVRSRDFSRLGSARTTKVVTTNRPGDQPRPSAMSLARVMAFISASTFAHSRCHSSSSNEGSRGESASASASDPVAG